MVPVRVEELAALADGALPPRRRAEVEAAVAASPGLARLLRVQLDTAQAIRTAAAQIEAPGSLRERASGNPSGPLRR
jgi:anti-sigma factor RsiW